MGWLSKALGILHPCGTSSFVYTGFTRFFSHLSQYILGQGRPTAGWSDQGVCHMVGKHHFAAYTVSFCFSHSQWLLLLVMWWDRWQPFTGSAIQRPTYMRSLVVDLTTNGPYTPILLDTPSILIPLPQLLDQYITGFFSWGLINRVFPQDRAPQWGHGSSNWTIGWVLEAD